MSIEDRPEPDAAEGTTARLTEQVQALIDRLTDTPGYGPTHPYVLTLARAVDTLSRIKIGGQA